mmetsp:Transcript_11685/g.25172  ORF Transcript_11685/g.25172 Transcript_11685/m.25172 type:complete len:95 (+) Transcript_11685:42-326(+)
MIWESLWTTRSWDATSSNMSKLFHRSSRGRAAGVQVDAGCGTGKSCLSRATGPRRVAPPDVGRGWGMVFPALVLKNLGERLDQEELRRDQHHDE